MTKIRMEVQVDMLEVGAKIDAKPGDRIMVLNNVVIGVAPRNISQPMENYIQANAEPFRQSKIQDKILELLQDRPMNSRTVGDKLGMEPDDRSNRQLISKAFKTLHTLGLVEPLDNGAKREFTYRLKQ